MNRLLELRQLEYDMIELETELSEEQYQSLVEEGLLYGLLSSNQQYRHLKVLHNILMRITSIHEERIGFITVEVVDTGWCPTAEFWNAACQASKNTYKGINMNAELYTKLKHCWKMGYKLPKIKEYCETDYSLDDLQELFREMWENELEAYAYKQECDRVLLSQGNTTGMATKLTPEGELHKWLDNLVAEDQAMGLYEGDTL